MKKLLIPIVSLLIIACSTVPLVERKQVILVPQSQMLSMSYTNYKGFLDTNKVITTGADAEKIQRVGKNISESVEAFLKEKGLEDRVSSFNWEFNLVDANIPNAWCMPGGKTVFYSGILPLCQDETGIAVVMGHEIAHAVARHGNERMSQSLMISAGGMALSEFLATKPKESQQLFLSAFAMGSKIGVMLPFSRKHEYEADKLGLIFMAKAGYNPEEAINFWQRMSQLGGNKPPEFLSTHPADENRIAAIRETLPTAMKYYRKAPVKH